MAQMPKRVKHRKVQRGHIKGNATRGNTVVFGDFGLQSLDPGWLKAQTIEAGRIAAQQYIRGEGKLYIRVFRIARSPRLPWKHGWVRVKVNQSTGWPRSSPEQSCTNWRGHRAAGQNLFCSPGSQNAVPGANGETSPRSSAGFELL
jgi:hypothetical protein